MSPFAVDKRDIEFCLFEYLKIDDLCKFPRYADFNRELFEMVINEAIKYSTDVLAPLNTVVDREGAKFDKGRVSLPTPYYPAYKSYCDGGWIAPSGSREFGGQGLPQAMNAAVIDIQGSACITFVALPALGKGVGGLLEAYGSEQMKKTFIEKLYSGVWSGTMCLTESGAGSAVGDLKTKAKKEGDHYLIEGEKIFITCGEHDLTENIIHMVLARVEGAPKGIKGISLFLVPRVRVKPDGSLGEANHVTCGNIEHKMGLKGSPTCTMIFGGDGPCHGTLVGQENEGIKYMFKLMNEARIGVGLQGLSLTSASYLEALQYSHERIQGVDIAQMKNVDAPRVPIINHPDVRRNLLIMKAFSEGMRALIYFSAKCADMSEASENEEERAQYMNLLDVLTPVCKAYCSDWGFRMTEIGIQILGGYGFIQEYPQEQYLRDCKPASIYEGTNGIQALDLLGRKIAGRGGIAFMTLLNHLNGFIEQHREHKSLGAAVHKLVLARDVLTQVVMHFQQAGMSGDHYYPVLHATPFLDLFGTTILSYLLIGSAVVADEKLEAIFHAVGAKDPQAKKKIIAENPEAAFYEGKIHSMRFFTDTYLPQVHAAAETIMSGNRSPLEITFLQK